MDSSAKRSGTPQPAARRKIVSTPEFRRWASGLDAEKRHLVGGQLARIAAGGPMVGRPDVDRIHQTRLHKLKEARVDRGIRVLFAFDSNRNLVALGGGDKTGTWNKWYPAQIKRAERLYIAHERSIGKEAQWTSRHGIGRPSSGMSR